MATYYPQLLESRILNDSGTDQSGSANGDVTNWDKSQKIIIVAQLGYNGRDTTASAYKLQWRNETTSPGGSFSDVGATGQVKYSSSCAAISTDDAALAKTSMKCTNQDSQMTWQNGLVNVADNTLPDSGTYDLGSDCYTEFWWAVDLSDGTSGHQYTFQLYNTTAGAAPANSPNGAQVTLKTLSVIPSAEKSSTTDSGIALNLPAGNLSVSSVDSLTSADTNVVHITNLQVSSTEVIISAEGSITAQLYPAGPLSLSATADAVISSSDSWDVRLSQLLVSSTNAIISTDTNGVFNITPLFVSGNYDASITADSNVVLVTPLIMASIAVEGVVFTDTNATRLEELPIFTYDSTIVSDSNTVRLEELVVTSGDSLVTADFPSVTLGQSGILSLSATDSSVTSEVPSVRLETLVLSSTDLSVTSENNSVCLSQLQIFGVNDSSVTADVVSVTLGQSGILSLSATDSSVIADTPNIRIETLLLTTSDTVIVADVPTIREDLQLSSVDSFVIADVNVVRISNLLFAVTDATIVTDAVTAKLEQLRIESSVDGVVGTDVVFTPVLTTVQPLDVSSSSFVNVQDVASIIVEELIVTSKDSIVSSDSTNVWIEELFVSTSDAIIQSDRNNVQVSSSAFLSVFNIVESVITSDGNGILLPTLQVFPPPDVIQIGDTEALPLQEFVFVGDGVSGIVVTSIEGALNVNVDDTFVSATDVPTVVLGEGQPQVFGATENVIVSDVSFVKLEELSLSGVVEFVDSTDSNNIQLSQLQVAQSDSVQVSSDQIVIDIGSSSVLQISGVVEHVSITDVVGVRIQQLLVSATETIVGSDVPTIHIQQLLLSATENVIVTDVPLIQSLTLKLSCAGDTVVISDASNVWLEELRVIPPVDFSISAEQSNVRLEQLQVLTNADFVITSETSNLRLEQLVVFDADRLVSSDNVIVSLQDLSFLPVVDYVYTTDQSLALLEELEINVVDAVSTDDAPRILLDTLIIDGVIEYVETVDYLDQIVISWESEIPTCIEIVSVGEFQPTVTIEQLVISSVDSLIASDIPSYFYRKSYKEHVVNFKITPRPSVHEKKSKVLTFTKNEIVFEFYQEE